MSLRIIEAFIKTPELWHAQKYISMEIETLEQKVAGHHDTIIVIFENLPGAGETQRRLTDGR